MHINPWSSSRAIDGRLVILFQFYSWRPRGIERGVFAIASELEKEVRELEPIGFLTYSVRLDKCLEDGKEQKRTILKLS